MTRRIQSHHRDMCYVWYNKGRVKDGLGRDGNGYDLKRIDTVKYFNLCMMLCGVSDETLYYQRNCHRETYTAAW